MCFVSDHLISPFVFRSVRMSDSLEMVFHLWVYELPSCVEIAGLTAPRCHSMPNEISINYQCIADSTHRIVYSNEFSEMKSELYRVDRLATLAAAAFCDVCFRVWVCVCVCTLNNS